MAPKDTRGSSASDHSRELDLARSSELFREARKRIPLGAQTFSKSHMAWSVGAAPLFASRGKGARVWDVDGNEYIDFSMGLGAVLLGHGYAAVNQAVMARIRDGISFAISTPLEDELAKLIVRHVPSANTSSVTRTDGSTSTGP